MTRAKIGVKTMQAATGCAEKHDHPASDAETK
jgi:hypothetical protein